VFLRDGINQLSALTEALLIEQGGRCLSSKELRPFLLMRKPSGN
jgi:hypothetical protein